MIVLDTNILIYYFQGEREIIEKLDSQRASEQKFGISIITKIELLSYPKITSEEIKKINNLLKEFRIFNVDEVIASKATEIRRKYRIPLADAIIAATAFFTKSPLVTRNIKHFQKIKEIKVKSL